MAPSASIAARRSASRTYRRARIVERMLQSAKTPKIVAVPRITGMKAGTMKRLILIGRHGARSKR